MWQFDVQPSSFVGQAEADDVQSAGVAMASCDFIESVNVAKRVQAQRRRVVFLEIAASAGCGRDQQPAGVK